MHYKLVVFFYSVWNADYVRGLWRIPIITPSLSTEDKFLKAFVIVFLNIFQRYLFLEVCIFFALVLHFYKPKSNIYSKK